MSHAPATPMSVPVHRAPHLVRHLHQNTPPIFWIPRRSESPRRTLQAPHSFSSIGLTPYAQLPVDAQQPLRS